MLNIYTEEIMDFKDIYQTLSKLDLSKHLEKKMGLTYLSWANAWDVMMTHFPTAQFAIEEPVRFDDGSMEVWTKVMIEGHERVMWLPVMDHRNQAIKIPSSRQVSDARMRCLVKNLAMFGLGLYVYQGEDLPRQEVKQVQEQAQEIDIMDAVKQLTSATNLEDLTKSFKALTKGHTAKSDFYTQLKQVAAKRKGELNVSA
jgi:hypothetical protein